MVCVFARTTSEPLTGLVKQIDKKIGEDNALKAFVVLLSDKPDATARELEKVAKAAGIQSVPLTVFDGADGPEHYQLAKEADLTVVMWRNGQVKVSRGLKGALTEPETREIVADLDKILGK